MSDLFDTADFYDCDQSAERLDFIEPEDALEYWLNTLHVREPGCGYFDYPAELTVYAWKRAPIQDRDKKWMADHLFGFMKDLHDESEFANPDAPVALKPEAETAVRSALQAAVEVFYSHVKVWGCEQVAERTYTEAEMRALFDDPKESQS